MTEYIEKLQMKQASSVTKHKHTGRMDIINALFIYALLFTDLFRKVNELWIHLPNVYSTYLRNSVYILLFAFVLYDMIIQKRALEPITLTLLYGILLIISILLNQNVLSLLGESILLYFSRVLPAYYIARYTRHWAGTMAVLDKLKWVALAYAMLIFLFPDTIAQNYMTLAYNMLIPTSVIACSAIIQKKRINWLLVIPFVLTMFVYGARGPILCLLFSIGFAWFYSYKKAKAGSKLIFSFLFIMVFLLLIVSFDSIIKLLSELFPNSRTLTIMQRGTFFNPSGRDGIFETVWDEFWRYPFSFRSLHGDSVFLSQALNMSILDGVYVHNFALEVLFDFGLPIGSAILLVWLNGLLKSVGFVGKTKDSELVIMFAVIVVGALPRMMVSGTFVTDYSTWLSIGMLVRLSRNTRRKKSTPGRLPDKHLIN